MDIDLTREEALSLIEALFPLTNKEGWSTYDQLSECIEYALEVGCTIHLAFKG